MKKLLLSALMITGLAAFAQKDIEVTLISPAPNATIRRATAFNIAVQFKNTGMDEIPVTDTLRLQFSINGNTLSFGQAPHFWLSFDKPIKKDSSVYFVQQNVSLPAINYGPGNFCAKATLRTNGVTITESSEANNEDCNDVTYDWTSGTDEVAAANSLNVYPNPASDVVNFNMNYSKGAKIEIMDVTGRLIEATEIEMNTAQVNVSTYTKGIYLYNITSKSGEVIKAGKFTVN